MLQIRGNIILQIFFSERKLSPLGGCAIGKINPCQFLSQGYFSEPRAMFLCNNGDGHTGQFVYIKDEREEQEYLGLCEVQVFPKLSKSNKTISD